MLDEARARRRRRLGHAGTPRIIDLPDTAAINPTQIHSPGELNDSRLKSVGLKHRDKFRDWTSKRRPVADLFAAADVKR